MSSAGKAAPRRLIIAGAALLVAAVLIAALAFARSGGDAPPKAAAPPAKAAASASPMVAPPTSGKPGQPHRVNGDPYALGRVDAPVVMVEYSDFQCPFCGRFARETKPRLIRDYVDTGVLRIEWRNFPIFGPESRNAARAGYAAALQGRFWGFHDLVYAKPHRRNAGDLADGRLLAWAREAGVPDMERFRRDMNSEETKEAVQDNWDEGYEVNAISTPTFLINGRPLLGAQPYKVFADAIAKAKGGR
ncbi:DsbA family protein [Actinomadura harenae]|uniref:Disulfide bond formation protein DsbA n=1 Tax=Actinomadura harenae TaxID=2483351 RepID=A0A3M2LZX3_9ACTN|nr:thioredoxin domain-containing protein [Actinomadura harenae]RMI42951.1 disulfide bond formation protein DsbA [Actinomadura harenae]